MKIKVPFLDFLKGDEDPDELQDLEAEALEEPENEDPGEEEEGQRQDARRRRSERKSLYNFRRKRPAGPDCCVLNPVGIEDAARIGKELMDGSMVILLTQQMDPGLRQRVLEFVKGVIFCSRGQLTALNETVYVATTQPDSIAWIEPRAEEEDEETEFEPFLSDDPFETIVPGEGNVGDEGEPELILEAQAEEEPAESGEADESGEPEEPEGPEGPEQETEEGEENV